MAGKPPEPAAETIAETTAKTTAGGREASGACSGDYSGDDSGLQQTVEETAAGGSGRRRWPELGEETASAAAKWISAAADAVRDRR